MKISASSRLLLAFVAFALTVPVSARQDRAPDKEPIIKKSTVAYYRLKSEGLTGFQCVATPDWEKFISENFKMAEALPQSLVNKLKLVQANLSISDTGVLSTTFFLADGSQLEDSISEATGGLAEMLNSFLQAWWPYVFDNSLGDFDTVGLKKEGSGHRIRQKEGDTELSLLFDKDSVISEVNTTSPGGSVFTKPKFTSTAKGLLLTNLESDITSTQQHVSITVEYQDIDGFKLPAKLADRMTSPTMNVSLDVTFSKYKVSKR
jgi:hypothetical protein